MESTKARTINPSSFYRSRFQAEMEKKCPNQFHIKCKLLRLMLNSNSAAQHVPVDWLECTRKPVSFVRCVVLTRDTLSKRNRCLRSLELMNKFRKMEFECYCQRCEPIKSDVSHPFWAQLLLRTSYNRVMSFPFAQFPQPAVEVPSAHTSDLMAATPLKIQAISRTNSVNGTRESSRARSHSE